MACVKPIGASSRGRRMAVRRTPPLQSVLPASFHTGTGKVLGLDALFYRLRNAGPWRDLPERFGPWQTVHGWHNRWAANGLWTKILKTLTKRSRGRVRLVDGSHVPVHQSGCNPTKSSGPAQMGKTRGGRNTTIKGQANYWQSVAHTAEKPDQCRHLRSRASR